MQILQSAFLSTPSARRATWFSEGDGCESENFYPRPPRGGRRLSPTRCWTLLSFLSTPSARRATLWSPSSSLPRWYFYPRPPRGGRRLLAVDGLGGQGISIHALREEGDVEVLVLDDLLAVISIHALREEGDNQSGAKNSQGADFYPRPPRGGRHFQQVFNNKLHKISIHALREEGDLIAIRCPPMYSDFYPRPPRGGRPSAPTVICMAQKNFYPRPPRGGRRCPDCLCSVVL